MIVHCVFCHLTGDAEDGDLPEVMAGLETLCAALDGALSFEAGVNRDFEAKSAPYSYGFVIRFRDAQALQVYAEHPEHQALGARLCALCVGGAKGVRVYDLEV